ncbi:MAG: hypothetical protein ACT4TC_01040 [Myxococcaceae bacterium]
MPLSTCDTGVPERADAKVLDPAGDAVPLETTFTPGPSEYPGRGVAKLTFTPKLPGWHQITVQFEPSWGTAVASVYVLHKTQRAEDVEVIPVDGGLLCENLQRTQSGLWLCGNRLLGPDGGVALTLEGRARVAGNTVWAYSNTAIRAYEAVDGGLAMLGVAQRNTLSTDPLLAGTSDLWALVRGGPVAERYSVSDAGVTRTATVDAGRVENGATLLFAQSGQLFIAESQTSSATNGLSFSGCALGLEAGTRACQTYLGELVGSGLDGVYSYSETERTLRYFTLQDKQLLPRSSLNAPTGIVLKSGSDMALAPVFSHESFEGRRPYLITPRLEPSEGLVLEYFDLTNSSGGANARFVWSSSSNGLSLWRRTP